MTTITRTIDVTPQDIKDGEAGNCAKCPIALAGKRAFPEAEEVLVAPGNISIFSEDYPGTGWIDGDLPYEAGDFMGLFDHNHKVKPFSFTVTFEYD